MNYRVKMGRTHESKGEHYFNITRCGVKITWFDGETGNALIAYDPVTCKKCLKAIEKRRK